MKNGLFTLALCLMVCTSIAAQPRGRGEEQRGPRGVNWDQITGITTEQKEQLTAIETSRREAMRAEFSQQREQQQERQRVQRSEREDRHKKRELARQETNKLIEGVLSAEQYQEYNQKREERSAQVREDHRGRRPQNRDGEQQRSHDRRGNRG